MRSKTSQGTPLTGLRRALASQDPRTALLAATGVEHVPLPEALELCLLLLDAEPARYDRAAARWHARACLELRAVGVDEAGLMLAALTALRGPEANAGAAALAAACRARSLPAAAIAVERWAARRAERVSSAPCREPSASPSRGRSSASSSTGPSGETPSTPG
jgi:hypothetical protein